MLQVYTEKIVKTIIRNAIVVYSVIARFLNFADQFYRYLIDYGYTLVSLLPVLNLKAFLIKKMLMKLFTVGIIHPHLSIISVMTFLKVTIEMIETQN